MLRIDCRRALARFLPVMFVLCASLGLTRSAVANDKELKFKSVADFNKCADQFEDGAEVCLEPLDKLVKSQPGQAFAAGKAVRAKMNHAAAVPFFAKALQKKADQAQCADPDLRMALVAGLSTPPDGVTAASARTILFDRCWSEAQGPVLQALAQSGAGYLAENVCPKLADRKVASPACDKKSGPPAPASEKKWTDLDPRALQTDGSAKVYRGGEGRNVTLVKLKNEDAYLVKFDGFRGEWNGRVVLHREAPSGSGYDYFTQVAGLKWVSVVVRDGATEVYPRGDKGPFALSFDEATSRSVSPQAVLEQFRKQR